MNFLKRTIVNCWRKTGSTHDIKFKEELGSDVGKDSAHLKYLIDQIMSGRQLLQYKLSLIQLRKTAALKT